MIYLDMVVYIGNGWVMYTGTIFLSLNNLLEGGRGGCWLVKESPSLRRHPLEMQKIHEHSHSGDSSGD